ncbi:unnamed protein product [Rotaria sordida]|uniref:Uncharacterized protein n=1 Tax=Rotaria sordida TaxID=392033 RepID=A0A819N3I9_9BILA|nr:unnamed protein product [Rotaria sordida]
MASSSTLLKAPCATCSNKSAGIFRCEGCLQVFCRKHLNEHRDFLSHQLDEIAQEHDILQQTIVENEDKHINDLPILKHIDQWEKVSIEKIQQAAEEARVQVKKLTSLEAVSNELHDLAERLEKARIDDDYVETDLRTWTTILEKLKDDINTFSPSIFIQENSKEILVPKMYISTTLQQPRQKEQFGESYGPVYIENNDFMATHIGRKNGTVFVRGISEYSSGIHKIQFLFTKNSLKYTTWFDIVSALMPISGASKLSYEGYGWSSDDDIYCPDGEITVDENYRDMKGQTSFEIELQLDCDNRKISYINQRTKNQRELNIDITKCPFPWQLLDSIMYTLHIFVFIINLIYINSLDTASVSQHGQYLLMRGRVIFLPSFKISIESGARLIVELQDTSLADAPAKVIARTIRKAVQFPISFAIKYLPSKVSNRRIYSLSATVRNKKNELLYINNVHVRVIPIGSRRTKFVNIPVIRVKQTTTPILNKYRWPELIGKNGQEVVNIIKKETGFTNVVIVKEGSPITLDYRVNRVRVFVNDNGIVVHVPTIG